MTRIALVSCFSFLAVISCSRAPQAMRYGASEGPTPAEMARADSGRPPYTRADVHFISGMIAHHGQAITMAGWAPTHGANASVRALCERIVVGQRDEILIMQNWLRDRGEAVPSPGDPHATMAGMSHGPLMPGMLSAEEMAQLDRARGAEFDRLFLTFMIRHHQGALAMVDELLGSSGAAQDGLIYKMASDVTADQSTEIERMTLMLNALPPGGRRP